MTTTEPTTDDLERIERLETAAAELGAKLARVIEQLDAAERDAED